MRKFLIFSGITFLVFFTNIANAVEKTPDVRLLIDVSGSMNVNDPEKLRIPSIQLLANLLPTESQAGIWTFGTSTANLAKFGKADDKWKNYAVRSAKKINSVDLYTDVEAALKAASFDIRSSARSADKNIILLSDGMVDISRASNKQQKQKENLIAKDRLLKNTLPKLVKAGYKIHTIALSNDADKDLLNTLAQQSGGLFGIAQTNNELLELFTKALQRSVVQEEVPLDKNSNFLIDNSIIEFTLLAFHNRTAQPVKLQAPDGRVYSHEDKPKNMNWYTDSKYDLITVKKPIAGDWHLLSSYDAANRVTVVSNLKMRAKEIPANIQRGKNVDLEVWFEQDGKIIKRQEFLSILSVTSKIDSQLSNSNFTNLQRLPNASSFKGKLYNLDNLGDFIITINANGKTFTRTIRYPVRVQDLIVANLHQSDDFANLTLRSQFKDINPNNLTIDIIVGNKKIKPAYKGNGEWNADLTEVISNEKQAVQVNIFGELVGRDLNMVLGNMTLDPKINKSTNVDTEDFAPKSNAIEQKDNVSLEDTPKIDANMNSMEDGTLPNIENIDTDITTSLKGNSANGTDSATSSITDNAAQDIADNVDSKPDTAETKSATNERITEDLHPENTNKEQVLETFDEANSNEAKNVETEKSMNNMDQIEPVPNETLEDKYKEDNAEENGKMLWLYILVGLGNIILFVIAFIIYKKFIKLKREQILND